MKDFSAFLDMGSYKNWAHKIGFWKYLSEYLSCQFSPEHKVLHFCSPPWTPFSRCGSSAVATTHCLILAEVDDKYPWQVPTCSWQALKYNIKRKMWRCKCGRLLQLSNIIKAMIFGIWGNYQSMKVSGELPIFAVNLQFHCRFSVV